MSGPKVTVIIDMDKARQYLTAHQYDTMRKLVNMYEKAEATRRTSAGHPLFVPSGARAWQLVDVFTRKGIKVRDFTNDHIIMSATLNGNRIGDILYHVETEEVTWPIQHGHGDGKGKGLNTLLDVCETYGAMIPKTKRGKKDE